MIRQLELRRSRSARLVQMGAVLALLASVLIQLSTVSSSYASGSSGEGDTSAAHCDGHTHENGNSGGQGDNGNGQGNDENNGNGGQGNNGQGHGNTDNNGNSGQGNNGQGHGNCDDAADETADDDESDHDESDGDDEGVDEATDTASDHDDESESDSTATTVAVHPGIDVEKFVVTQYGEWHNADTEADGPRIPRGDDLLWIYVVTNWGNVDLDVTLHDDVEGAVTCPLTTLAAGGVMHCELAGTAVGGHYVNTAHVVGDPGDVYAYDVEDSDDAHYTGLEGGISIEKYTNGHDADEAPGPNVVIGDTVVWTYVFTNTGEVPLYGVRVHDDTEDVVVCENITLEVGETKKCELTGTVQAGQYTNTGHVVGDYGVIWEMDDDPSHYYGIPKPTTTTVAAASATTVLATTTTVAPTTTAAPTTTTTAKATTTTTEKTEVLTASATTVLATTTTVDAPVVGGNGESLPVTGSDGRGLGLQGLVLMQVGAVALLGATVVRRRDQQSITVLSVD